MGHRGEVRRAASCRIQAVYLLVTATLFVASQLLPDVSAAPLYGTRVVVLNQGPMGAWDQAGVMQPTVLLDGGLYRMWYVGTDGLSSGLGYVVSQDGRRWDPVVDWPLVVGSAGWTGAVLHPSVLNGLSGGYDMWFSRELVGGAIGHASSSEGINWDGAVEVLTASPAGSWDAGGIGEPTVVHTPSGYWMWYTGVDGSGENASIGLASSTNGMTWTKHPSNPILRPGTAAWNAAGLSTPGGEVLGDGTFVLFLSGSDGNTSRIGRAVSSDGYNWTAPDLVLDVRSSAKADSVNISDPVPSSSTQDIFWYSGYDGDTWRILMAIPLATPSSTPLGVGVTAVFAFTAGLATVGTVAFVTSDRFKYAFFAIPLAFKLVKEKNLDQFVRGQIYQYIRENPGDYYSSIMASTGATNGNLAHHLHVLEKQGFIVSSKDGRFVRFYPKDVPIPTENGIRYSSLQVRIIQQVSNDPGITQSELGRHLNVKKQTIAYNVFVLMENGVLYSRRLGKETRIYIKEDGGEEP